MTYQQKLTWKNVKDTILDKIDLFEDPVYSSYIDRDTFINIYDKVLIELDGGDHLHYFSNYFEPSPINNSILIFINDDMRKDFYEFALELELVMPLEEIFEGESSKEKEQRMLKQPKPKKPSICPLIASRKRSEQMIKTLDKLSKRLENETDSDIRTRIENKINRILLNMDKTR